MQLSRRLLHNALGVFGRRWSAIYLLLHSNRYAWRAFEENDLAQGERVLGNRRTFLDLGLHLDRVNLILTEPGADDLVALHMPEGGAEDAVVVQSEIRHAGCA